MKVYTKNNLKLKSLTERTNGFIVRKGQIQLKELKQNVYVDGDKNTALSQINTQVKSGNNALVQADAVMPGQDKDNLVVKAPKSANPTDAINNTVKSLQKNGIKSDTIDNMMIEVPSTQSTDSNVSDNKLPRTVMELRNNSVTYSKDELNKILLNK